MPGTNNYVIEIYKQCNEHLKETDKKRDQLIGFFAAVVALFFNASDKVGCTKIPLGIALGILGITLSLVLTSYRKWHTIYVKSAIVIQNLLFLNQSLTNENIEKSWQKMLLDPDYNKFAGQDGNIYSLLRTERLIHIAFLIVAFIPFYVLGWGVFFLHPIYVFFLYWLSEYILKREFSKGSKYIWILRNEI